MQIFAEVRKISMKFSDFSKSVNFRRNSCDVFLSELGEISSNYWNYRWSWFPEIKKYNIAGFPEFLKKMRENLQILAEKKKAGKQAAKWPPFPFESIILYNFEKFPKKQPR